jgi:hypothetical protein
MSNVYQQFPRTLSEVLYPGDIVLVSTRDVLITWPGRFSSIAYMFRPYPDDNGTWWPSQTIEFGLVPENPGIAIVMAEDILARMNSYTVPDDFPF